MARWNAIDWPVADMKRWYEDEGLSVTQIAAKLDKNPKLVWKVCKKHRFAMRPVGSNPGSKNPSWTGGRIVDKSGYILVHMPEHPRCTKSGYIREHRLVAEKKLGRFLTETEVVHHINDDPGDNRPENLIVFDSNGKHLAETIKGQVPQWTEQGLSNIRSANLSRSGKKQMHPIEWPSDSVLREWHLDQLLTLADIAKALGCGQKRLANRMHFRNIPVRMTRSKSKFVPRKHVLPSPSVLCPSEFDALLSQGKTVHPVKSNEKSRRCPSQKADSQEPEQVPGHSMTA